jgi:hypothetical protein
MSPSTPVKIAGKERAGRFSDYDSQEPGIPQGERRMDHLT